MRGFFGIGVEGITKPMNIGSLLRTAQAFDASFVFTIAANYRRKPMSDTGDARSSVPFYNFESAEDLLLPRGCKLVGVELVDDAELLPSFCHPRAAAYVLGRERGSLSPELQARCDLMVKIPTRFCVNVGTAGAIVMYDRLVQLGRFPARPLTPGGPIEPLAEHVHGGVVLRREARTK